MKFIKEKLLLYKMLAEGDLKKAAKIKKHLLKRTLKRKANGKKFTSKHIVK